MSPAPSDDVCYPCVEARCAIVMVQDPLSPGDMSVAINNMKYASLHGYDFLMFRCPPANMLTLRWFWDAGQQMTSLDWFVPVVVEANLPDYDYILYLHGSTAVSGTSTSIPAAWLALRRSPDDLVLALRGSSIPPALLVVNDDRSRQFMQQWVRGVSTPFCRDGEQRTLSVMQCLQHMQKESSVGAAVVGWVNSFAPFAYVDALATTAPSTEAFHIGPARSGAAISGMATWVGLLLLAAVLCASAASVLRNSSTRF
jgi:hypothetical protein